MNKNTSFELTLSKSGDYITSSLTRSPCQSMMIPKYKFPIKSALSLRAILSSFTKLQALAPEVFDPDSKVSTDDFEKALTNVCYNTGVLIEPILEHFNLIDRKGRERLNLTLRPDENLVKIPWELAILPCHEPDQMICQKMNIGRTMEIQEKEGFLDRTNTEKRIEHRALIIGINYAKRKDELEYCSKDARIAEKELKSFGKINHLSVYPPLIGKIAKKKLIKKRLFDGLAVFHFSGHGNLDTDVGEVSLMRGKLTAKEVAETCKASGNGAPVFSFMNACETCLQKPNRSGVYDWARAMAYNGGRALVGTFWTVEDEAAADFSATFYQNFFAEGRTIGESVRLSREALNGKSGGNLVTWAAFVLYGPPNLKAKDILV